MFGCVKKAIMLVGDTSTQVSSKRREQGLTKLNPVLAFWGKEDFLYSGKQLFADGLNPAYSFALKQRILLPTPRKLVTPFFVALPPEGSTGVFGVAEVNTEPPTEASFGPHRAIRPQAHHLGAGAEPRLTSPKVHISQNHI